MTLLNKKIEAVTPEAVTPEAVTPEAGTKAAATKPSAEVVPAAGARNSVFITDPELVDAVADADYGTLLTIVATNGIHKVTGDGGADLGKVLKFQAILSKSVWKVAPGNPEKEAKEYFKVSRDGETCIDGQGIKEALQDALDAGYSKASIKEYVDVICIITECANSDFVGQVVILQLAPSSQFSWRPLAGKCKIKAAMGTLVTQPVPGKPNLGSAVVFTSVATPTSKEGQNFTKFIISV